MGGTRSRALTRGLGNGLLTQRPPRSLSPDVGWGRDAPRVRGTRLRVDAEREGIPDVKILESVRVVLSFESAHRG